MPIGIIIDACAVALGGLLGSLLKPYLKQSLCDACTLVLGLSSMGMGISTIVLMKNMPAVVFSLIFGTIIGLMIRFGDRVQKVAEHMLKSASTDEGSTAMMVTALVLFCASGTGIYGSLCEGMSQDHTILIAKSILDLFTAMIFGCTLGKSVSLTAVPQALIFLCLYLCAGFLVPFITDYMLMDFKACGGFIMLATGLRMTKIKDFPLVDILPSLILVMPVSWFWVNCIAAFL